MNEKCNACIRLVLTRQRGRAISYRFGTVKDRMNILLRSAPSLVLLTESLTVLLERRMGKKGTIFFVGQTRTTTRTIARLFGIVGVGRPSEQEKIENDK